jgi:hypothetical protein
MANDHVVVNGDERENQIACSAQIVDQLGLSRPAKRYFFDDADGRSVAGRFKSDNHPVKPTST